MAFKDNNEKNNLNQDAERPDDSPEMKQYKKERQEAIDAAKRLELELAHKLEKHEFRAEEKKAQDFMRQTDFPEIHPKGNNSPEYEELQKMFAEIQTDHVQYNFLRKILPSFIKKLESSRLGENLAVDIAWIPLGGVESLADATKLSGHFVVDFGELLIQPKVAYERTKSMIW